MGHKMGRKFHGPKMSQNSDPMYWKKITYDTLSQMLRGGRTEPEIIFSIGMVTTRLVQKVANAVSMEAGVPLMV